MFVLFAPFPVCPPVKFTRHARPIRASLEAAPWVAVLFLLVMFLLLAGRLHTPGVRLELPAAENLPGVGRPTVTVALDAQGRLYFENQFIDETRLRERLAAAVQSAPEKPALVVLADRAASYEHIVRLTLVARDAGIEHAVLATLPGPFQPASRP